MRASGSGGISGGGSSIGSGGANLARGSTKVGGQNIDDYVEELIVGTLRTDNLWSKVGVITSLKVTYLNAYGLRVGDREVSFDEDDISQIYNNKRDIAKLEDRISALESKPSTP